MAKGGVSFTATVNRLWGTPSSYLRPLLFLLPRCPIDSWGLVMKSMLAGARDEGKAGWMEPQP